MSNWDDIKEQIREAEEPLSENAWASMEQMLDAKPKSRFRVLWFALAAAVLVGLYLGTSHFMVNQPLDSKKGKSLEEGVVINEESETLNSYEELKNWGESERDIPGNSKSATKNENSTGEVALNKRKAANQPQNGTSVNDNQKSLEVTSEPTPKAAYSKEATEEFTTRSIPALPIRLPSASASPFAFDMEVLKPSKMWEECLPEPFNYRWELRAFAMATYNLAPQGYETSTPSTHVDYGKATENAVSPGLGFDAGIEVKYRVFKHFKIGGGIEYRRLTNRVSFDYETNKIPLIDSASGHIIDYFDSPNTMEYSQSGVNEYTFISVPVSVYYEIPLRNKWSLGAEAIYNHSFLLSQNSVGVNPTQLSIDEQGDDQYRSSIGSAQFRLSLMYQLKDNLFLAAEPSYRHYLNSFDNTENINWTPRDLSVSLSIIYRLNNLK